MEKDLLEIHKNFQDWIVLKEDLHLNKRSPYFKEREIWWTSIGYNVGSEQHGRNSNFERPVLIIRNFNNKIFWGLPLTGRPKKGRYYYNLKTDDREVSVITSQLRVLDSKRLIRKMHIVNEVDFSIILNKVCAEIKTASPEGEASEPEGIL